MSGNFSEKVNTSVYEDKLKEYDFDINFDDLGEFNFKKSPEIEVVN